MNRCGEEKAYAIARKVSYLVGEAIIDIADAETTQVGILCGVELFVDFLLCKLHLQTNVEIMQHLHKAMFSPMWYRHFIFVSTACQKVPFSPAKMSKK